MCLIIKKPAGRRISEDFLRNAWRRNADGWGAFWCHEGKVRWQRGMHFDELLHHNAQLPEQTEVHLHLRKATYGPVCPDLAHPYVVRPGLMLMHNGSIAHLAPQDPLASDTAELAHALRDMLSGLSDAQASALVRTQGFARLSAPLLDGSMVVLLDGLGSVRLGRPWHVVQSTDWDEHMAGIEVSNTHTWLSAAPERARPRPPAKRTPDPVCPP